MAARPPLRSGAVWSPRRAQIGQSASTRLVQPTKHPTPGARKNWVTDDQHDSRSSASDELCAVARATSRMLSTSRRNSSSPPRRVTYFSASRRVGAARARVFARSDSTPDAEATRGTAADRGTARQILGLSLLDDPRLGCPWTSTSPARGPSARTGRWTEAHALARSSACSDATSGAWTSPPIL